MKVLLLDDHPLVRAALESVIQSLGRELSVVAAASAAQARTILADAGPHDLALLDLHLPDADGFSLLVEWRRAHPDMAVVIISASEHPADVVRALDEGARGFIPKRTANEVLVHALRMVMSGGIYVPPMALRVGTLAGERPQWAGSVEVHESAGAALVTTALRTGHSDTPERAGAGPGSVTGVRSRTGLAALSNLRLTPRQSEVLQLLLQGQPNKLIARQLNLSVETVKDHVAALLRVLGVSSRTQAVLAVNQMLAGPASANTTTLPASPFAAMQRVAASRIPV